MYYDEFTPLVVGEDIHVEPNTCEGCGLYMSRREAAEQGMCNGCFGGAYMPD